jgi:hypothetical protein
MRKEESESGEKWRNGQPWESWVEGWFDVRICWQLVVSERARVAIGTRVIALRATASRYECMVACRLVGWSG